MSAGFLAACEEPGSTGPTTPAGLEAVGFTERSLTVGEQLSDPLTVRVLDAGGDPLAGVRVDWSASEGALSATSVETGESGEASVMWTLGTTAGEQTATATVGDLEPVVFTATARPGAVAAVAVTPDSLHFTAAGDTARLDAAAADEYGNDTESTLLWTSSDETVATVDSTGLVTAQADGTARIVAASNGIADSAIVVVEIPTAAARFELTDLGPVSVFDINGSGEAIISDAAGRAYLWSDGTTTDLGDLGGDWTAPSAISDSGDVVGSAPTNQQWEERAFLWQDGTITNLGRLPGGTFSEANDINDAGLIVGESEAGGDYVAVVWTDTITKLPTLGVDNSTANAVNGDGWIVGYAENTSGSVRAVLWTDSTTIQDLGALGGSASSANAINASGQIVGWAEDEGAILQPFLYENGAMQQLPSLGGELWSQTADPLAINAGGQIVGMAPLPNADRLDDAPDYHAVLWEDGEISDLNDLVDAEGWVLTSARAINTSGEIVGMGQLNGEIRAFLLRPKP